jgi:ferredoxin
MKAPDCDGPASDNPAPPLLHWPGHPDLTLAPGQTVLAALEAAGLPWPASCRNGTCRTCIGRLAAGRVRHTIPWPGLSADEKADGCFLACVAVADDDVTLAGPGA